METTIKKAEAREDSLKKRSLLNRKTWEDLSFKIQSSVLKSDVYKDADEILIYASVRGETNTFGIIEDALKEGKKVALPKSFNNGIMDFYYINSLDDLVIGKYNIPEPPANNKCSGEAGLMIMPGVAFDKQGNRCGYGAGYYDRYLKLHTSLKTAAICFSFQVYESIEHNSHDIKPDIIFTEKETIYVNEPSK